MKRLPKLPALPKIAEIEKQRPVRAAILMYRPKLIAVTNENKSGWLSISITDT
jgi:hypothetical protein